MAITGRLLRVSRPLRLSTHASSTAAFSSNCPSSTRSLSKANAAINDHRKGGISSSGEKKSKIVVKAAVVSETAVSTQPKTKSRDDLGSLLMAAVADAVVRISRFSIRRKSWKQQVQMMIEKSVVDCRFFMLFAVAGSLLGSILCFVEGCFFILESYFEHFHILSSNNSDQGHVMHLLIEAIDMFLLGGALLIFGMGMYAQFVGSTDISRAKRISPHVSNFFGVFHLKGLPACIGGMQSVAGAKSKIGHAVLMILQVGVLDKFKSVPLVTSIDLACFAGAVLISSACVFLLSKLSM